VAEAAEGYFRRAKDFEGLYRAVETKLGEQRRFVLWYDGQPKDKGAAEPGTNRGATPSQYVDSVRAEDFGLDRDTIHRWRTRLKDARKFDRALEAAQERCVRICEAHRGHESGTRAGGRQKLLTVPSAVLSVLKAQRKRRRSTTFNRGASARMQALALCP
jgi:hypothetical protein